MHKTIYIDIDEEITSVIDRIRREGAPDIFLVMPKNALLSQGILNLKLLKKESDRLGKHIMMVTNDKQAKKVIERAGLTISNKPVPEPEEKKPTRLTQRSFHEAPDELSPLDDDLRDKILAEGNEIGSHGFYDSDSQAEFNSLVNPAEFSPEVKNETILPPTHQGSFNANPAGLRVPIKGKPTVSPVLNSRPVHNNHPTDLKATPRNVSPAHNPNLISQPAPNYNKNFPVGQPSVAKSPHLQPHPLAQGKHIPTSKGASSIANNWQTKEAEEFFSDYSNKLKEDVRPEKQPKSKERKKNWKFPRISFKKIIFALFFLFIIGGAINFFTNAAVKINLYPTDKSKDYPMEIKALTNPQEADVDNLTIPGKDEQIQITKTLDFNTTGEKSISENGKSKGKVTILNKFSSAPQTLVASSRILSKEGKMFRLVQQVTVPGQSGTTAGKVEADVVADETGESYDIGPSTFTIEGFKGTPKYSAFEITSSASMQGGQNIAGSNVKVVSAKDIEDAREKTMDQLENSLEEEIKNKLGKGTDIYTYVIKKDISKAAASLKEGDQADTFNFTVTQDLNVRVVLRQALDEMVRAKVEKSMDSGYRLVGISQTKFDRSVMNKDGSLSIFVVASAAFKPTFDVDNIKAGIYGKPENEVRAVLGKYKEIDKIEIKFSPVWKNVVPLDANKITVNIIDNQNNK